MGAVEVMEVKVKALNRSVRAWKQAWTGAGVVVLNTNPPPDQPHLENQTLS